MRKFTPIIGHIFSCVMNEPLRYLTAAHCCGPASCYYKNHFATSATSQNPKHSWIRNQLAQNCGAQQVIGWVKPRSHLKLKLFQNSFGTVPTTSFKGLLFVQLFCSRLKCDYCIHTCLNKWKKETGGGGVLGITCIQLNQFKNCICENKTHQSLCQTWQQVKYGHY